MNSPNYPPPGGPQGPYGPPQGQPFGGPPPQTPPGGQPYGGPPPQGQPFGAPPPQGQPFGAPPPGVGGPAGGPGGPGGAPGGPAGPGGAPPAGYAAPPPPPPAAKPNNTAKFIKIGIGVVVVAVIAVFAIINWGTSASSAEVGDCITVKDAADADVEKIDCNDASASYKVAAKLDSSSGTCPDGDYVTYTQSGRRSADLTLCLMLNAKEGDCFHEASDSDTKVDCGDAKASVKVTKVITGTTETDGCPEGTKNGRVYSDPATVQCFGPVSEA